MAYPRKQYVLGVRRGRKTSYFYGTKLGDLIKAHVKVGEEFFYSHQITDDWRLSKRTSEETYSTVTA